MILCRIDVSPVEVERSEDGRLSGRWAVKREEGGTGWVEVTSLLLGEPGRMRAMPPSLRIKTVGPVLTPHEHIMVCIVPTSSHTELCWLQEQFAGSYPVTEQHQWTVLATNHLQP